MPPVHSIYPRLVSKPLPRCRDHKPGGCFTHSVASRRHRGHESARLPPPVRNGREGSPRCQRNETRAPLRWKQAQMGSITEAHPHGPATLFRPCGFDRSQPDAKNARHVNCAPDRNRTWAQLVHLRNPVWFRHHTSTGRRDVQVLVGPRPIRRTPSHRFATREWPERQ